METLEAMRERALKRDLVAWGLMGELSWLVEHRDIVPDDTYIVDKLTKAVREADAKLAALKAPEVMTEAA